MRDFNQFDQTLMIPAPGKSRHNVDRVRKTTLRIGELTPILCMETVPGGEYNISAEALVRFMPLVTPTMTHFQLKIHVFYAPNRILWNGWQDFIMEKPDKLTGDMRALPTFKRSLITFDPQTRVDLPRLVNQIGYKGHKDEILITADPDYNALPLVMYQKIYNRWYRHKKLTPEVPAAFGPDSGSVNIPEDGDLDQTAFDLLTPIRRMVFQDDYFNIGLQEPQAGEPVFVDADAQLLFNRSSGDVKLYNTTSNPLEITVPAAVANSNDETPVNALYSRARIIIEEIRRASAAQLYVEVKNHATTYIDHHKAFYNVTLPDYMVQEPQYITGNIQDIIISDVQNHSDINQGRLTGNANGYSKGRNANFFAHEHGLIMAIACVTYKPEYLDAQERVNLKTSPHDFFNPMWQSLGPQAIWKGELSPYTNFPKGEFAYVDRFSEYKHGLRVCTDEFQTTLAHWHTARALEVEPRFTEDFVEVVDERRNFVYQDPDSSPILLEAYFDIKATLPMQQKANPQII